MSERMEPNPETSATPPKATVLVTGDVLVDHHIYEGERHRVSAKTLRGLRCVREWGGACLVERLLGACFDEALATQKQARLDLALELAGLDFELAELAKETGNAEKLKDKARQIEAARAEAQERLKKFEKPLPEDSWECAFALTQPNLDEKPCAHHALATWKPFPLDPKKKNSDPVWRAEVLLGYGHDEQPIEAGGPKEHCERVKPEPNEQLGPHTRVVVLDDGGFVFRQTSQERCWLLPPAGCAEANVPDYYVLKMSDPVAQGDLWAEIEMRKASPGGGCGPDITSRLIVILSANDLRRESTRIARGLSWEGTVEDVACCLRENPMLRSLATVPCHLIVTFSADGALWLDFTESGKPAAHLIYDADGAEGEWAESFADNGEAFGYHSCLTASVTRCLCLRDPGKPLDLKDSIAAGLAAMRDLRREGHGRVEDGQWPKGFPVKRLARLLNKGVAPFSNIRVPWPNGQDNATDSNVEKDAKKPWRLLESSQAPFGSGAVPSMLGLARQYVIRGAKAIECLPHARFGDLITADREEIETLRTLRGLMLTYKKDRKAKKPLSIGIFGPPGAGKSFGVKQIATAVFGAEGWKEFNLSQFQDGDLIGAFHQLRDLVLTGIIPVAFWDEFDSRDYHWLQYLLAPMQDGQFQEQQITHPIGKCVFLFAGGTAWTYEEFGPRSSDDDGAKKDFRLKKGPDFHSRLDGYYNVLGPNPRTCPKQNAPKERATDPNDVCAPLRRAILIRSTLGLAKSDLRLDIDRPLLDALLEVGTYRHGARSLEKLVQPLKPEPPSAPIRPSQLPPDTTIAMHTESPEDGSRIFTRLLAERSADPFADAQVIEELAERIHESWRTISQDEGWTMAAHLDRDYRDLEEADKEDNRAAARRMPGILALVGLTIVPAAGEVNDTEAIQAHIKHHEDLLAEAEHDGWMDRKIQSGWRIAKVRNDRAKQHDCLVPFKDLADFQKAKDRDSVRHFQDHLKKSHYRIVFS